MKDQLLTYQQLEKRWSCTRVTARKIIRRHKIPTMHLGSRTIRFCLADVIEAETRIRGKVA